MKWVTEIELSNYRAFTKTEQIKIPFNHHLLIYGENGSGKTSIYNALKDLFRSSQTILPYGFTLNEFEKSKGNLTGSVSIEISTKESSGIINSSKHSLAEPASSSTNKIPEIQVANKLKGFLDYKIILKTHALEIPPDKTPNFFEFFVHDLLGNHPISNPAGGVTTNELSLNYSQISKSLKKNRRNSRAFSVSLNELQKMNEDLKNLIKAMVSQANLYLDTYFKNKLVLDVGFTDLKLDNKKNISENISLKISYAGNKLSSYHTFLNEARLSSLAICLYLASIKINPMPPDSIKILYLDDVFIGLDMCNRIPLLEIIKDEFIDHEYQLFISTFDRQWYELSRQWLEANNCNYKCIELFTGDFDNSSIPDSPVVLNNRGDYLQCAKSCFSIRDYPAAANYLRKSCEAELKRILPENKRFHYEQSNGETRIINNLNTLITNFDEYIRKNGLNYTPFLHFKTYKKVIFNPLSHDDLNAPHYKREISDCVNLVEELKNIQIKHTILTEKPLKLGVKDKNTGNMHHYSFELLENLQIIKQGANPVVLSPVGCNLIEGSLTRHFTTLFQAFDEILVERNYPATTDYTDFFKNISVNSRKKLIEFM